MQRNELMERLIYTTCRFAERILYKLLSDHNFFIIVYNFQHADHGNKKRLVIENEAQMSSFINCEAEYLAADKRVPQYLDICFITVPVKSYSFKRLWILQKQLVCLVDGTHHLRGNYFIEEMYDTSICIGIYGPTEAISESIKDNEAVILIPSGYGDIFRHAYILQEFIRKKIKENKKISLVHTNPGSKKLSEILYKNCENLYFDEFGDLLHHCKKVKFSRVFSMWDIDYLAKTRKQIVYL